MELIIWIFALIFDLGAISAFIQGFLELLGVTTAAEPSISFVGSLIVTAFFSVIGGLLTWIGLNW